MGLKSILCAFLYLSASIDGQCNTVYQRKEIRQLSSAEIQAFFQAVRTLNSGNQPSKYASFVKTHLTYAPNNHGTANFLVWHRLFLREFEKALQAVNPNVALPYWNWSYDSQAPELSGVLSDNYFGGEGTGQNNCVTKGQFANWQCYYDYNINASPHCLARKFNGGDGTISAFYSPEAIQSLITNSKTYDQLRQQIEYAPHGSVHNGVGGDMQTMASTNDPLFWLHHAFIDKIYHDWQQANPSLANTISGKNQNNRDVGLNDIQAPFNVPSSAGLNINSLCYTYTQDGVDITKPPQVNNTMPNPTSSSSSSSATPTSTLPSSNSSVASSSSSSGSSSTTSGSNTSTSSSSGSASSTPSSSTSSHGSYPTYSSYIPIPSYLPIKYNQLNINITIGVGVPIYNNIPITGPTYNDRQDPYKLRLPKPLPESWARMNNYPLTLVREQESKLAQVISAYNQIGFKSPVCLAKRPDLSSHLNIKLPIINLPILKPLPFAHPNYNPNISLPENDNSYPTSTSDYDTSPTSASNYDSNSPTGTQDCDQVISASSKRKHKKHHTKHHTKPDNQPTYVLPVYGH
ncbi:Di-copper centre-containing protein [Neoconidiobolus thromboides FSU 785]|nr:Di-copper centre-containing protein [Neoconidiobolus thromboides FSU 785]